MATSDNSSGFSTPSVSEAPSLALPRSGWLVSLIVATCCGFPGAASAVLLDFESPGYTAGALASVATGTTDKPFSGQDGWSVSTGNSGGLVAATVTSGEYSAGQAIRANPGQTYIGAKSGYVLVDPTSKQFTFDLLYGAGQECGVGLWNDDDADGLFDQSEGQIHFGVVSDGTAPYAFGYRSKSFGTRFYSNATGGTISSGAGVAGVEGHWYRFLVTVGDPDGSGIRQITMRVYDLTLSSHVDFDSVTPNIQNWVANVPSANFGAAPADCEGTFVRVTTSGSNTAIDNINGPPPPVAPVFSSWDGGADPDNHWSVAANWLGDTLPTAGSILMFPAATAQPDSVNDLPAGSPFGGIQFDSLADARVLSGNSISLSGNVINASGLGQELAMNLSLTGDANVVTGGDVYLVGAVSGPGSITKSGASNLELSGNNTYSGTLVATGGTVTLMNDQSGANGGITIGPLSASTTTVELAAGASAAVASGKAMSIGNTIASGTASQTFNVSGAMTNDGSLYLGRVAFLNINDGGTWTQNGGAVLEGIGGYNSNLTINTGGTFTHASATPFVLKSGTNDAGRGRLNVNGGTLVTAQGFDFEGGSAFTARVTLTNGGVLKLSGSPTSLASDILLEVGGSGGTIDTNGNSSAIDVPISGTGSFFKRGTGTLNLNAASIYGGETIVEAGTLALTNIGLNDSSAVEIAPGAILHLGFAGVDIIGSLYLDGDVNPRPSGKYGRIGSIAALGANYETPLITGDGLLEVPSNGFSSWASDLGLNGAADADFDHDGLADAVEYVAGSDPKIPNSLALTSSATGSDFIFTFSRDDASETADVTLTVQSGTDLVSWPLSLNIGADTASSGAGVAVSENGANPDTITVTIPKDGALARFGRLNIHIAP